MPTNQLTHKLNETNRYYSHIDGLRGIAVLSVILFHLDVAFFSGGFVGVDIFFVISGYLITSQIQENLKEGVFSFSTFYIKRARRLMPALLFTLCMTLIAGYVFFPYANFERLSNTTLSSLFSISNFWFWREAGYFDTEVILKPLLHTWSLSVEEQFYLIWPGFLLFLNKGRLAPFVIVLVGIISLILAELWLEKDSSLVFYMTPFRIVEFSVGGIVYWLQNYKCQRLFLKEIMSISGLLLICLPMIIYDSETTFPGITALIPCIGSALLIYSGSDTSTGKILKNKFIVFLGLISYSLYLVHWPVIVFYNYSFCCFEEPVNKFYLTSLSFFIAVLMFYFIEQPFRKKVANVYLLSKKNIAAILGSMFVLILTSSIFIHNSEGVLGRENIQQLTQKEILNGKNERFDIVNIICGKRGWDTCQVPSLNKDKNVLIIGDSHAADGLNIFYQAFPDYHYVIKSLPGCPPIVISDTSILPPTHPEREQCLLLNEERLSTELLQHYDTIVISVFYDWYTPEHLSHAIDLIKTYSDAKVIVLGNYIILNKDMSDLYNQGIDLRTNPQYVKSFALYENELSSLAEDRYTFISKKELLCTGEEINSCLIAINGIPFTFDQHHLSKEMSAELARKLITLSKNKLENLL